jgi:basic membrane protein A
MTDLVPAETQAAVNEVKAKIEAGEFPIFVGPIYDNAGNMVVKEGETLGRDGIWETNYLVKGVTAVE